MLIYLQWWVMLILITAVYHLENVLLILSINLANSTSRTDNPLQSWVDNTTSTLLYTLSHSGWCCRRSAWSDTMVMNAKASLKSLNWYFFSMASRFAWTFHPFCVMALKMVSLSAWVRRFGALADSALWRRVVISTLGNFKAKACHDIAKLNNKHNNIELKSMLYAKYSLITRKCDDVKRTSSYHARTPISRLIFF